MGKISESLESNRYVNEISENDARGIWLSSEKKGRSLIKRRSCKIWIARNTLDDSLIEITSKRHYFFPFLFAASTFFLALYSSCSATA